MNECRKRLKCVPLFSMFRNGDWLNTFPRLMSVLINIVCFLFFSPKIIIIIFNNTYSVCSFTSHVELFHDFVFFFLNERVFVSCSKQPYFVGVCVWVNCLSGSVNVGPKVSEFWCQATNIYNKDCEPNISEFIVRICRMVFNIWFYYTFANHLDSRFDLKIRN